MAPVASPALNDAPAVASTVTVAGMVCPRPLTVSHSRVHVLEREQLYEGRDLALTTDMRAVFAELSSRHLGAARPELVFPGYAQTPADWPGVLRA